MMEVKNIENLCRTCANKEENMTLINSSLIIDDNMIIIAELLNMFNVGIRKDFPSVICPVCLEKVVSAHEFKLQCEKSTTMLETIIDSKKTLDSDHELDTSNTFHDYHDSPNNDDVLTEPDVKHNEVYVTENHNFSNHKTKNIDITSEAIIISEEQSVEHSDCNDLASFDDENKLIGDISGNKSDRTKHKTRNNSKKKHDDQISMFCAECNKPFKNKYILISHVKRHRNKGQFLCNVCGKGFNAQSCLSRHSRVHTGERKYECEVCHKKFPSSNNLTLHSRRHSGIKPYLCTLCGKCFSHPTGLTYHLRTHTKEKPYACDVCGRRFTIQCHRERHRKTHSGERPFACNMCDKAFIKKFDLQRHQDVHLGNKPYVCSICNKAFVRKMHLNYHMMVHTEERPHVCNHCGKGFIRRYYLTSHVKKHHSCDNNYNEENITFELPS